MIRHWREPKRTFREQGNMKKLILAASILLTGTNVQAQAPDMVRAHDAMQYVGEYAMVCGVIASASYQRDRRGAPTYLNFDKAYPEHEFSAILYGKNRPNFKIEPETLTGYKACVYGKIKAYKGKAQIVLVKENQLSFKPPQ